MKPSRQWFADRKVMAVFCFLLGMASLWAVQGLWSWYQDGRKAVSVLKPPVIFFYDRFFSDDEDEEAGAAFDPWREMEEIEKHMMGRLGSPLPHGMNSQNLSLGSGDHQIEQREDDKFVIYEIQLDGEMQKKMEVKVESGQVYVSGEVEKKRQEGNQEVTSVSSFQQSLPVPENTDANKVEVTNDQGKIVLKFPKL